MTTGGEANGGNASSGSTGPGSPAKWIWLVLGLAIATVLLAKVQRRGSSPCGIGTCELPATAAVTGLVASAESRSERALPRLVDLGAGTCIPCKMMTPVLDDLKKTYSGKLEVEFIDIRENAGAAEKYGIQVIPTQIFYDAGGKELFRHEGFFPKEDILAKWKEFGVDLPVAATNVPGPAAGKDS